MDRATINKLAGSAYLVWAEPPKPKPHIEYPKMVYLADGSHVIVHNADEEAVARGETDYPELSASDKEHPGDEKQSTPDKPRRGRPPKAKE